VQQRIQQLHMTYQPAEVWIDTEVVDGLCTVHVSKAVQCGLQQHVTS
jgi:hypothetical protein